MLKRFLVTRCICDLDETLIIRAVRNGRTYRPFLQTVKFDIHALARAAFIMSSSGAGEIHGPNRYCEM